MSILTRFRPVSIERITRIYQTIIVIVKESRASAAVRQGLENVIRAYDISRFSRTILRVGSNYLKVPLNNARLYIAVNRIIIFISLRLISTAVSR